LDAKLPKRKLDEGETLVEQGAPGDDLYLLLDGVFGIEVDGEQFAEMWPGTMLGERASLESGVRTATLRALTPCRVVVIGSELAGEGELVALAADRQCED
jgi:CRP-like cAMP-binding protein